MTLPMVQGQHDVPVHTFAVSCQGAKTDILHVHGDVETPLLSLGEFADLLGGTQSASQLGALLRGAGFELYTLPLKRGRSRQQHVMVTIEQAEYLLKKSRAKTIQAARRWWTQTVQPFLGRHDPITPMPPPKDFDAGVADVVTDAPVKAGGGKNAPGYSEAGNLASNGGSNTEMEGVDITKVSEDDVYNSYGVVLAEFSLKGESTMKVFGTMDHPWFLALQLEELLELQNIRQNIALVLDPDEHCKKMVSGSDEKRHLQTLVSESGLYKLVARSNKPAARQFDRWVRSVVLPSIRRTGTFSVANRSNRTRGGVGDLSSGWISQGSPLCEADKEKWASHRVRTAAEFCKLSTALALVVPFKEQVKTRIRVSNQLNSNIMGGRDNADIRRMMEERERLERRAMPSVASPPDAARIEGGSANEQERTEKRPRDEDLEHTSADDGRKKARTIVNRNPPRDSMIGTQLAALECAEQGIVNACIEAYCDHDGKPPPAGVLSAALDKVGAIVRLHAETMGIHGIKNTRPVADLEASKELLRSSEATMATALSSSRLTY